MGKRYDLASSIIYKFDVYLRCSCSRQQLGVNATITYKSCSFIKLRSAID